MKSPKNVTIVNIIKCLPRRWLNLPEITKECFQCLMWIHFKICTQCWRFSSLLQLAESRLITEICWSATQAMNICRKHKRGKCLKCTNTYFIVRRTHVWTQTQIVVLIHYTSVSAAYIWVMCWRWKAEIGWYMGWAVDLCPSRRGSKTSSSNCVSTHRRGGVLYG